MAGLTADFREGGGLPDGLQLAGAEPEIVEDEDGTHSLLLPPDESVCPVLCLGYDHGISPWTLEDDGKLHAYTLIIALRLDNLPSSSLPLFNGGAAASASGGANAKPAESVQIFKNGGQPPPAPSRATLQPLSLDSPCLLATQRYRFLLSTATAPGCPR
jgi:hypothetical protein